ncbi:unnamed protein product [Caenorhabditis sp. 36 PRJEB53466]|nr:unnamed protein product [Caenorhabditis sp. 36 PRJEB53466]
MNPRNLWTLRLFVFLALSTTVALAKTTKGKLATVSKDLSIIARIANGIALAQEIDNGNITEKSVLEELVYIGHNVTLETLSTDDVAGLETDLKAISAAVKSECGGAGGCWNEQKMADGVALVETIARLRTEELAAFSEFQAHYKTLADVPGAISTLINAMESMSSGTVTIGSLTEAETSCTKIRNSKEAFENITYFVQNRKQDQLTAVISDFIQFTNQSKQTAVNSLISELPTIRAKSEKLSQLPISKALEKVRLMASISFRGLPSNERALTRGFFDRFDDLNRLSKDLSTNVVKQIMAQGKNTDALKSLLKPVLELNKVLSPLQNSWNWTEHFDKAGTSIETVRATLEAVADQFAGFSHLDSLKKCIETVKLGTTFPAQKIADLKVGTLDQKLTSFAEKLKSSNALHADLKEFYALYAIVAQIDVSKKSDDFKSYKNLDKLKSELTSFNQALADLMKTGLDKSLPTLPVGEISKWLKDSGVGDAGSCLRKDQLALQAITVFSLPQSLLKLNEGDSDLTTVSTSAGDLKVALGAYAGVQSKMAAKPRKTNAIATQPQFKDALETSRSLADGIKIIRDLNEAYQTKNDMKAVMTAEQTIDAIIQNITDVTAKGMIAEVWNDKTKKTLKELPGKLDQLEGSIEITQKSVTDYRVVFTKVEGSVDFSSLSISHNHDLFNYFYKLILPYPAFKTDYAFQKSLRSTSGIDLEFLQAADSMNACSKSLKPMHEFLDDLFEQNRSTPSDVETSTKDNECSSKWWYLLLCGVAGFVLGCLATFGGMRWAWPWYKKRAEKEAAKKKETKKEPSNEPSKETLSDEPLKTCVVKDDPFVPVEGESEKEKKEREAAATEFIRLHKEIEQLKTRRAILLHETKTKEGKEKKIAVAELENLDKEVNDNTKKMDEGFYKRYNDMRHMRPVCGKKTLVDPDPKGMLVDTEGQSQEQIAKAEATARAKIAHDAKIDKDIMTVRPDVQKQPFERPRNGTEEEWQYCIALSAQVAADKNGQVEESYQHEMLGITHYFLVGEGNEIITENPPFGDAALNLPDASCKTANNISSTSDVLVTAAASTHDLRTAPSQTKQSTQEEKTKTEVDAAQSQEPAKTSTGESKEPAEQAKAETDRVDGGSETVEVVESQITKDGKTSTHDLRTAPSQTKQSTQEEKTKTEVDAAQSQEPAETSTGESKEPAEQAEAETDRVDGGSENVEVVESQITKDGKISLARALQFIMSDAYAKPQSIENRVKAIPAAAFIMLIEATIKLLEKRGKDVVNVSSYNGVWVVADTHGNFDDLQRYAILCEGFVYKKMVVLGDVVDRGERSVDSVVLMCVHMCAFPDGMFYIKGNHEEARINRTNGFYGELKKLFGKEKAQLCHQLFNKMTGLIPLAATIDKQILCVHGGISSWLLEPGGLQKYVKRFPRTVVEGKTLVDITWADFRDIVKFSVKNSEFLPVVSCSFARRNVICQMFNAELVRIALGANGLAMVLHGHVEQDGLVSTVGGLCANLFSATNYHGGINKASAAYIEKGRTSFAYFEKPVNDGNGSVKRDELTVDDETLAADKKVKEAKETDKSSSSAASKGTISSKKPTVSRTPKFRNTASATAPLLRDTSKSSGNSSTAAPKKSKKRRTPGTSRKPSTASIDDSRKGLMSKHSKDSKSKPGKKSGTRK